MRAKLDEKRLFPALALLLAGVFILLNTTLVSSPVKLSEKGIVLDLLAIFLLFISVRLFGKSIHRQK